VLGDPRPTRRLSQRPLTPRRRRRSANSSGTVDVATEALNSVESPARTWLAALGPLSPAPAHGSLLRRSAVHFVHRSVAGAPCSRSAPPRGTAASWHSLRSCHALPVHVALATDQSGRAPRSLLAGRSVACAPCSRSAPPHGTAAPRSRVASLRSATQRSRAGPGVWPRRQRVSPGGSLPTALTPRDILRWPRGAGGGPRAAGSLFF
jgi:hypothetical protein